MNCDESPTSDYSGEDVNWDDYFETCSSSDEEEQQEEPEHKDPPNELINNNQPRRTLSFASHSHVNFIEPDDNMLNSVAPDDQQSKRRLHGSSLQFDMSFGSPLLPSRPSIRRVTSEQMHLESCIETERALEQLSREYIKNPRLLSKTHHFSRIIKSGDRLSSISVVEPEKEETRRSFSPLTWFYSIFPLAVLVLYVVFGGLLSSSDKIHHTLSGCDVIELQKLMNNHLSSIISTIKLSKSPTTILHAVSCVKVLEELWTSSHTNRSLLCQNVYTKSHSGLQPIQEQMELALKCGENSHCILERVGIVQFMLDKCDEPTTFVNLFDDDELNTPIRKCLKHYSLFENSNIKLCSKLVEAGADLAIRYSHLRNGSLLHDTDLDIRAVQFIVEHVSSPQDMIHILNMKDEDSRSYVFNTNDIGALELLLSINIEEQTHDKDLYGISALGYRLYRMALQETDISRSSLETFEFLLHSYRRVFEPLTNEDIALLAPWIIQTGDSFDTHMTTLKALLLSEQYWASVRTAKRVIPLSFVPIHYDSIDSVTAVLPNKENYTVCLVLDFVHSNAELVQRLLSADSETDLVTHMTNSLIQSVELQVSCDNNSVCESLSHENNHQHLDEETNSFKYQWDDIQDDFAILVLAWRGGKSPAVSWSSQLNYRRN